MTLGEMLNAQIDLRSALALARQGYAWWIEELTTLLPAGWRERLSRRPRVLAERLATGGWRLWRRGRPIADGDPAGRAGREVGLLLPPRAVLVREVRVPRMSGADTRRMLTLDIDRLSPLSADLVHFDFEILDRDGQGGRQTLLLGIVERAVAARSLAEARAAGWTPVALGVGPGDGEARPRFDFLPAARQAEGASPGASQRLYWRAGVAALLALNLAILVGRDLADVSALRRSVEAQRPAVATAVNLRRLVESEEARRGDLVARGVRGEPLRMLDALTQAVPAGAWVQHLEWNGRTLRIVGFRTGDLDMAAAIRGSGSFANPRSLATDAAPRSIDGQPFDITADARSDRRR